MSKWITTSRFVKRGKDAMEFKQCMKKKEWRKETSEVESDFKERIRLVLSEVQYEA